MKPLPKIEPCDFAIPEPLLRAASAAEHRQDDALNRLLIKLDADGKTADLERLIDIDKLEIGNQRSRR